MLFTKFSPLPDLWHQRFQVLLWAGLLASLPWTDAQSTRFTGIFSVSLIIHSVLTPQLSGGYLGLLDRLREVLSKHWLLFAIFLATGISMLWSTDLGEAGHIISVRSALLWMPVIWALRPLTIREMELVAWTGVASVFALFAYAQRDGLVWLQDCPVCYMEVNSAAPRQYLPVLALTPAVVLLGTLPNPNATAWPQRPLTKYVASVIVLMLALGSYAKMGILACLVAGMLVMLVHLTRPVLHKWILGLVAIVVIAAVPLSYLGTASLSPQSLGGTTEHFRMEASVSPRITIYGAVVQLLFQDLNWLHGIGTGSFRQQLTPIYCRTSIEACAQHYNPHSQYLELWLQTGLLGLYLWTIGLVWLAARAIRQMNLSLLFFTLLMAAACATECYLNREMGVLAFCIGLVLTQTNKDGAKS